MSAEARNRQIRHDTNFWSAMYLMLAIVELFAYTIQVSSSRKLVVILTILILLKTRGTRSQYAPNG